MATKTKISITLFLIFNLLFFAFANACDSGCNPKPSPPPSPKPGQSPPGGNEKCPIDALKLAVCANVLNGLLNITIGTPPKEPCCSLLGNLVDLEAAVCLCTAIKANILGINLNLPIDLSLLLNYCGKNVPRGIPVPLKS